MSTQQNAPAFARRAYASRPPQVVAPQPDISFVLKDAADEITKFTQSTGTLRPVSITNVKPIASYSWIEARTVTPTIAIPGERVMLSSYSISLISLFLLSHTRVTPSLVHWPPASPGRLWNCIYRPKCILHATNVSPRPVICRYR